MQFAFVDRSRAQAYERVEAVANARFADARLRLTPESRAAWIEAHGTIAVYDGPESPLTQTFGLGFDTDKIGESLDAIEAFYAERASPVCHEVCAMAGIEIMQELARRSYAPVEHSVVLHRPLEELPQGPEEVQARIIEASEVELWSDLFVAGLKEFPEFAKILRGMGPVNAQKEGCVSFMAWRQGTPIAVATLDFDGETAILSGAGTVPEARRQGGHSALIVERMRYAASLGCRTALFCALPGSDSHRNAERFGFRQAYTRMKWRKG